MILNKHNNKTTQHVYANLYSQEPPVFRGSSWSWSFSIWIYNYLCNQCLSPLTLGVGIPLKRGVLDNTLCDKVCQW